MHRFRNLRLFFGIHLDTLDYPERPFDGEKALNDRIKRFEIDANKYRLRFRVFQIIVILASGIIPIINLSDIASPAARLISSILGSLIIIVTGLTQMDKNHEMWILKGSVEHALKHEKLLFINGVYPYDNPDTNKSELIKKMNKIISSHLESYFTVVGEYRQNLEDNLLPKKNGNGTTT